MVTIQEFHLSSKYNSETFSHTVKFFISKENNTCKIVSRTFDRLEIMPSGTKVEKVTLEQGRVRWKEELEKGMYRVN